MLSRSNASVPIPMQVPAWKMLCYPFPRPPMSCIYMHMVYSKQTNKQTPFSKPVLARVRGRVDTSMRMRVCGYVSALPLIGSLALVRILTWQLHTQPPPAPSSHKLLRRCWYEWQEPDKEGGSRVLKLHWSSLRRRILQPMLLLHSSNPEASWNKNRRLKSHLPILSVYEIFI